VGRAVRLDVSAVDGGRFRDRPGHRQSLHEIGPEAPAGPAIEPVVDRRRGTVFRRAITPSAARLQDMDDARDHTPVIDTPRARLVARDMRFNQRPLRIAQPKQARHPTSSKSLKPLES